jgi:hypothetical protein
MVEPSKKYKLSIDSVLTQDGKRSLPKDKNGFYHLTLIPSPKQQLYRVTGKVLVDGYEPIAPQKISWESNLFWYIKSGDIVTYVTKTYLNYYTGQYTIVQLPPLISQQNDIVPTINTSSYSGKGGLVNTIIAPVGQMKGDTLIIKASNYENKLNAITKVVLE